MLRKIERDRHELMHFKRGDHILGLALSVLNAIYWFNPIVWIAFKLIRADMETACDSDVVRMFSSDEKNTYATVILSLFSKKQYGNLAVGMVQGNIRKAAEKRIRGVFMNHKTSKKVKRRTDGQAIRKVRPNQLILAGIRFVGYQAMENDNAGCSEFPPAAQPTPFPSKKPASFWGPRVRFLQFRIMRNC